MYLLWMLVSFMGEGELKKVMGGSQPVGSLWKLELVEDLRIRPDEDEDQYWAGSNRVVQVDDNGHMFVLDQRDARILEWDARGQFVRAIGGKGEGPGEFQSLVNLQIFPDQHAIAFENFGGVTKLTHFGPGFEYMDRKGLEGLAVFPRNGSFSPNRQVLATLTTKVDPQRSVEITEFILAGHQNGKLTRQHDLLYWETMSLDPSRIGDANHWAEFLGARFGSLSKGKTIFAAFNDSGQLYTAQADTYEITLWNQNLEKLMVFGRDYQPIPLTAQEIDALTLPIRQAILAQLPPNLGELITENLVRRAAKLAGFPAVKFPVAGLRVIEEKGVMVIHNNNPETLVQVADLFDTKGHYRGSLTHSHGGLSPMVFHKGFAYTLENEGPDTVSLVRYRYRLQ